MKTGEASFGGCGALYAPKYLKVTQNSPKSKKLKSMPLPQYKIYPSNHMYCCEQVHNKFLYLQLVTSTKDNTFLD